MSHVILPDIGIGIACGFFALACEAVWLAFRCPITRGA